ncbi:MAG: type VI secretion system baseplate subunit TssG [Gemmataceae bacterium]|nr:type VI secretion system baseplate subunit TssG [Gemmataceae bacterium]
MSERSIEQRLRDEPYSFDFFQAVRILHRLAAERAPVGAAGPPGREAVRFRALPSLDFPASSIHAMTPPSAEMPMPTLFVTFMGLHGPSGVMPRHYTDLILRLERDRRGEERRALRDWFDLFNHRFISLMFRAWEKYRFWTAYERAPDDDPFTRILYSLAGMGTPGLRNRLRVEAVEVGGERSRVLAKVEDQALAHYAGLLSTRRRTAAGLQRLLSDYFGVPVRIVQFVPQWLALAPGEQSRLGFAILGVDSIAGERVLDVQGKFRLRLGPLTYRQFLDFLPDRSAAPEHKGFWLLAHLSRLYAGAEFDIEAQLVLAAGEVPECQLSDDWPGPRLGWNCWLASQQPATHAEEVIFPAEEIVRVDEGVAL